MTKDNIYSFMGYVGFFLLSAATYTSQMDYSTLLESQNIEASTHLETKQDETNIPEPSTQALLNTSSTDNTRLRLIR